MESNDDTMIVTAILEMLREMTPDQARIFLQDLAAEAKQKSSGGNIEKRLHNDTKNKTHT